MDPNSSKLTRFLIPLAEQISTSDELFELKDLISSKKKIFEDVSQGVKQAIDNIEINIQWKTNKCDELTRYLTQINFNDSIAIFN